MLTRNGGIGAPSERTLTRTARMTNERDMRVDEIDLVHQRLPILDHALGLNTFLPEGQVVEVDLFGTRHEGACQGIAVLRVHPEYREGVYDYQIENLVRRLEAEIR